MVAFKTDTERLAVTVMRVRETVEKMQAQSKVLIGAVDTVNRWQGETADAFRATMGLSTAELQKLGTRLDTMHQGLNEALQGVNAQEARGKAQMNSAVPNGGGLSGAPLNA